MKLNGVSIERLAIVGGGAVAAKALDGVAKNVEFLKKNKYVMPLGKVGLGVFLQTTKSQTMRDAGLGVIAVGLLETLEVIAPNVFVSGIGSTRRLRTIDLDSGVSGGYGWDDMADEQGVAGFDPNDFGAV